MLCEMNRPRNSKWTKCLAFACLLCATLFFLDTVFKDSSYEYVTIVAQSQLQVGDQQYLSYIVDTGNGNEANVAWVLPNDHFDPYPIVKAGQVYRVRLELTPTGYAVLDYREDWISKLMSLF
jgi:hypothetical protein